MARTDVQYVIDNEEIPRVEQYTHVGHVHYVNNVASVRLILPFVF